MNHRGTWRLGTLGALAATVGCATLIGLDPPDPVSTTGSTGETFPPNTCAGGAGICTYVTDCGLMQPTNCVVTSCTSGCCGTTNAPMSTQCNDNGGHVCDGNGACIGCMADTDCDDPGTDCVIVKCDTSAHKCTMTNASSGTKCSDNGGTMCDGMGQCM